MLKVDKMQTNLAGILVSLALLFLAFSSAQLIDTSGCGKFNGCFRVPSGCSSSTTCNILISYKYNKSINAIDVAISSKNAWLAFGLSEKGKMDTASGEVCLKDSSTPKLKAFSNTRYSANFKVSTLGLHSIKNSLMNGAVICRYSRPLTPAAGSSMKDMEQKWFITAAYGDTVTSSEPSKHEKSGFSSNSKVNFTTSFEAKGGSSSNKTNIIVHGSLMIIAWMCFAATGMFIARYTKPVAKDSTLFGEKVWFQCHRICMVLTLLLTVISFIIIFAHIKGWSESAKAHPVTGCITTLLAIIQPIMAAFRPHPDGDNRWIFNWVHRSIGVAALALATVTVFLGLDLMSVTITTMIVWAGYFVLLVLIMEIGPCFLPNMFSGDYNVDLDKATAELEDDKTVTFRKVVMCVAAIGFFAIGFATIGWVAQAA